MSYIPVYSTRINWENEPSIVSPINATNLNKMDYALKAHDDTLANWDITKANESDLLLALKEVSYDTDTGVFVFTWFNGTTSTIDLNIEKIPVSFSMDANGVITMTTEDGTTYTADVGALIKTYTFTDSSVIDFTVTTDASGNKTVTADIVDGSIDGTKLTPNYLADCTAAKTGAETAEGKAEGSAEDAEAWAIGTRGGVPVPSTDPAYENNAEYWAHHTSASLAGLNDVNITNPQDKQALTYDANTGEWINGAAAGGGTASDISYDNTTSGLSATDVQDAIDEVDGNVDTLSTTKADKTQITNPNLLDNPWFTVNQRGQSSYSGSTYNVDRWRSWENGTVTVKSRGIGTTRQFAQVINNILPEINHKTVTISALLSDGTIVSTTGYLDIPTGAGTERVLIATEVTNVCNVLIYGNLEYASFQVNTVGTHIGVELELLACKLELGTVSTLAMDTAPNYATELLKCQRYFQRWSFPQYYTIGAVSASDSWIVLFVPSQKMRVLPTVVTTGTWYTVVNDTVPAYATSLGAAESVGGYNLSGARTSTGANTSGYAYAADAGGFVLELIADL